MSGTIPLPQRWDLCEHDQNAYDPHYSLCMHGCGAWIEYIPIDDRQNPDVFFELRFYIIEEEPG